MTEQIYINGVLMERSEGKSVSLVFQSPFFTEIDSIVSNRTTSVELPKTTNNLKAIELANLSGSDSLYEYRKHKVVYKRDGMQVFSGWGTLLSITDAALKFSFVWGNASAFKTLLDAQLRDLQTDDDYVGYNYTEAMQAEEYYPLHWNDANAWGGKALQPIMPVANIIKRITEKYGISFKFPNDKNVFDNYYIPLIYRNADKKSRIEQGLAIETKMTYDYQYSTQLDSALRRWYSMCWLAGVTYEHGLVADNGIIDVSDVDELCINISKGFAYTSPGNLDSEYTKFCICAVDEEGDNYQKLETIPTVLSTTANGLRIRTVTQDVSIVINVERFSYIVLALYAVRGSLSKPSINIEVVNPAKISVFDNILEELEWGGDAIFPLYTNLPDWTVSQLIKNLMKIEGLFAYASSDNEVRFATIGDLYSNRAKALDWTKKLSNKNDAPTEKQTAFNNLAQKNWMRWAEDDTVLGVFDDYIAVHNETLDDENELVTLDFAPSSSVIKVWQKNDDGEYEFNEVTPRILHKKNNTITFNGLDWGSLIRSKYYNYKNIIEYPHTIKARAVLDTADLLNFDMSVPIFVRQWGHYYAITKLTTKDNGAADLELLRLGRAKVWSVTTEREENYNGDMELAIERVSGGYAVTMKGVSENKIQEYIDSDDYHLAIFRYGYARRGKFGYKIDRIYGRIRTHTTRDKRYRDYRRRLRYRIIGHDILKGRAIKGQTATSPIYKYATLIFEFREKITLPQMKKPRSSKSGRLKNPSASGLGELYVGLIKRYEYGDEDLYNMRTYDWICISNMLQVRGYTDDHTKYWEFEKSNIR